MTDTTQDDPELLPCPFCGSPPNAGWFPGDYDIGCDSCRFSISEHTIDYGGSEGQAKSAAVMRWNTRADTAQAIVAAALTEAAGVTELVQSTSDKAWKSGDREHSEDFYRGAASAAEVIGRRILALITPDAQSALDRMLAEARTEKSPDR